MRCRFAFCGIITQVNCVQTVKLDRFQFIVTGGLCVKHLMTSGEPVNHITDV